MPIKMTVSRRNIAMTIGEAKLVYVGGEIYEGDYDITPKTSEPVKLPTEGKLLVDDVTVRKIPYYEVTNETGGLTIYIGDDEEIKVE